MPSDRDLIRAEGIKRRYRGNQGLFRRSWLSAVDGVDLTVKRGEILALVGESGSGKSTLGRILVRLDTPSEGRVWFDDVDIAHLRGPKLRAYRRRVSIVFQNPYRSLNPRMKIGAAIAEPLEVWDIVPEADRQQEVERLLENVGLPTSYARRLPHQLSGGERQRVAIARAISTRPELMVADEAVSSLDVSAAAGVLNLLMDLRAQLQLTCVFVTHDLSVARVLADRVAVMNKGQIVDIGTPDHVLRDSTHSYTQLLRESQVHLPQRTTTAATKLDRQDISLP